MGKFSKIRYTALVVLLSALFFVWGIYLGAQNRPEIEKVLGIAHKETTVATTADFDLFWKAWNTINEKYPKADGVSDQEKVYGAISGLVDSLEDPYSVFFSPEKAKMFEEEIAGSFTGVGMEVGMKDKVLTVIAPLKDTPAYRAGIKSGDRIIKIDETSTANLSMDGAIKLMRGEPGTPITLTILREGVKDPIVLEIVRDVINIPTLETELRDDGVFIIKFYSFSLNSPRLFRDAIKTFADAKTDKLILDLRGNPGGYLSAAVETSSWFLPKGKTVLVEDYGEEEEKITYRSKGYDVFTDKLKFVILIDGGSASASEIVAGAMQDYKIGKLVGEKSFGKGSVQEAIKLSPDTLLKITVAKWFTPNGNSLSENGLTPDYEVERTTEDIKAKKDPQLDKAVEVLKNWP